MQINKANLQRNLLLRPAQAVNNQQESKVAEERIQQVAQKIKQIAQKRKENEQSQASNQNISMQSDASKLKYLNSIKISQLRVNY